MTSKLESPYTVTKIALENNINFQIPQDGEVLNIFYDIETYDLFDQNIVPKPESSSSNIGCICAYI